MTTQDNNWEEYAASVQRESDDARKRITEVFQEVGNDYLLRAKAMLYLHQGHDVHAFYNLAVPLKEFIDNPQNHHNIFQVIHVQGYPGMSSREQMRVYARLMNSDKVFKIRAQGGVSIGNEHGAVIMKFSNFQDGVMIPYSAKVLEEMLAENIPYLKKGE
jgi:hypothetical protein